MSKELELALDVTRRAGRVLLGLFGRRHTVRQKGYFMDLVTEADLASERVIVEALRARCPEHRIVSEEGAVFLPGAAAEPSGCAQPVWLVDPLDGTVNYAHGYDVWAVTVALVLDGQVSLGAIYDPLRDQMWWAERGQGAWRDGARLQVSDVQRLAEALVATGFPHVAVGEADTNLPEFSAVAPSVHGVRRAGSAALDLANVAAGRFDGYWESFCAAWDWAAGWLMVKEAGGQVTDRRGEPFSLGGAHIVASNGRLHAELLALLRGAGRADL